jgi:hypothetical protein
MDRFVVMKKLEIEEVKPKDNCDYKYQEKSPLKRKYFFDMV